MQLEPTTMKDILECEQLLTSERRVPSGEAYPDTIRQDTERLVTDKYRLHYRTVHLETGQTKELLYCGPFLI